MSRRTLLFEHPDEFEIALRTWSAQAGITEEARVISELLDLDPALVDQMQTACRGDASEAACDLLEAVEQELVVRSS